MAALGRIAGFEPLWREDIVRITSAMLLALVFHLLLFQMMSFKVAKPFEVKEDIIAVELVTLPPPAKSGSPAEEPPEIEERPAPPPPKMKPKPKAAPLVEPRETVETPDILASSRKALAEDAENTVPLSETGTVSTQEQSERTTDDVRIDEGLKALAAELTCLNGFSTDCAEIRKDVFEDFQMTETDKVYTKKYAHTGMPVEFYGMSERQIRVKLNVPNAGENGLYIPFTNIGIDGDIWDMLHGVNKSCTWKVAIDKAGNHGPIKDCPDYLPAAKEDRDRRNKLKLKVNE